MAPMTTSVACMTLATVAAKPVAPSSMIVGAPWRPAASAHSQTTRGVGAPAGVRSQAQTAWRLASGSVLSLCLAAASRRPSRRTAVRPRRAPVTVAKAELDTPAVPKRIVPTQALFDPLGMCQDFERSRKVELVVARLAMLGAVGLPLAELSHESISIALGLPNRLAEGDRAPALHTGGVFSPGVEVSVFTVLVLTCVAAVSVKSQKDEEEFDPVTPTTEMSQPTVSPMLRGMFGEAEMINGRVAMIAVTAMCIQETLTGTAVVDSVPQLFGQ